METITQQIESDLLCEQTEDEESRQLLTYFVFYARR